MDFDQIKRRFKIKTDLGDKCVAYCSAHEDSKPSLSLKYDSNNEVTLVHCHAGCRCEDILSAVGLRTSDLYVKKYSKSEEVEQVYRYLDKDGNEIFHKIRLVGKKFIQKRYVGENEVYGLSEGTYFETYPDSKKWSRKERNNARTKKFPAINPVIYNLPQVLLAKNNGQAIIIVEGEKDADNLNRLGFTATTNHDGASQDFQRPKWRKSYNKYFKNANVILIPDNDNPGITHMNYIAESLYEIADSIKIVCLEGLNEKEDISDWLLNGHSKDELLKLIDSTPCWSNVNILEFNNSDVGNAERLVAVHGSKIKYNPILQKWMVWTGKYWKVDKEFEIERLAKDTIKIIQKKVDSITISNDTSTDFLKYIKEIKRFVLKSESDQRIKAMINQAKSQSGMIMKDTDTDNFLLNVNNGTINLRTGELKQHERMDNITKLISVDYDTKAECPNWIGFLEKIFKGDIELINYIQKSIGYSITGSTEEQCFFICYGDGANGKSTFLNTIQKLLGVYADTLRAESLIIKRNVDGPRGDLAKLQDKRFVTSTELDDEQVFDEPLLKALTGGDSIPVRFLFKEEFSLNPHFKIWMGTNEKPRVRGGNLGIWRRIKLIPFEYTFLEEEKETKFYEDYILPEMDGILKWAVEGCLKWENEGIKVPEKVQQAINEYKVEMDSVERYTNDMCIIEDSCEIKASLLYSAYSWWCKENQESAISNVKFAKRIMQLGRHIGKSRKTDGKYYSGIGLKADYIRDL